MNWTGPLKDIEDAALDKQACLGAATERLDAAEALALEQPEGWQDAHLRLVAEATVEVRRAERHNRVLIGMCEAARPRVMRAAA